MNVLVGVVKEIKVHESRVALPPLGSAALVRTGHGLLVETAADGERVRPIARR